MEFTQEELKRAAETLVEAERIKENKDLMKALDPYLTDTGEKIEKVKDLDSLREEARRVINGEKEKEAESLETESLGEQKSEEKSDEE